MPNEVRLSRVRGPVISAAVHAAVVLLGVGVLHRATLLAPHKLPGTAQGTRLLTWYSPGSPERPASDLAVKTIEKVKPQPAVHAALAMPAPVKAQTVSAERGTGSSPESGLGDGDIRIALETYFPHPTPDLNTLPRGTKGDVILNAVIDEQGKIADLTVIKGLGPSIDEAVVATVRHWTYSPATKNGAPVRSEQELHFHYERS